ncbi:mannose/glucose-specific lectin [Lactuca sativa]|uniref:Jacalin-type lectin domain-containing protein n=1 Tax=Lactuca sativa TaxID=4236 RepID=A0A9R1X160_LACSA|nr:mannose/glucose-specific lectin [Lactuca sativa]KAJ0195291.1 hypothetical protein LSAT_V11C700355390 [Lactuca sativa]
MAADVVWVAPWGGTGGNPWHFIIPDDARLFEIIVTSGDVIDSIYFTYMDQSGTHSSPKYGGSGGIPQWVSFSDEEVLIGISGNFKEYENYTVITSFSVQTNICTYGPFGLGGGSNFSIQLASGTFAGFYGKCGIYLDALGVILKP